MAITVSTTIYERIISCFGYPIFSLADISNGMLEEEKLKSILIWPAMEEYYRWFPKKNRKEYDVSGDISIDYDNANVFDVLDARFIVYEESTGVSGSPFVNDRNIRIVSGYGYGTGYDYDMKIAQISESTTGRAFIEKEKAYKITVDKSNSKIIGYTNITGRLKVIWAEMSEDFSDIPLLDQGEVIKLAQSNILDFLGNLRNQSNASLPTELDGDSFVEKAEKLKEEVMTMWKNRTKVVIMR